MMEGPIDTTPGRPLPQGPSRCLGCMPRILAESKHDCVGDRILAENLGWWCDCAEPECRRRQAGEWPAEPSLAERSRKRGMGRPKKVPLLDPP
ncbi:hypothetical protein OOJ91_13585 [Micromonospora lupini]|uniref:hypothetical protein n=1 Tax=Micromonospora lupini TaxID=285679 RepID=UPI00225A4D21|nr:hypothetical protein [Micromonospora lupini]MCX5066878.1 hypothetical protein [Micromonospora lupini]